MGECDLLPAGIHARPTGPTGAPKKQYGRRLSGLSPASALKGFPRRPRILMLNFEYPPVGGGTATATYQVLRRLASSGKYPIDLITSQAPGSPAMERLGGQARIFRLNVDKKSLQYWRSGEIIRWTSRAYNLSTALTSQFHYHLCHCWMGWPAGWVGYWLRGRFPLIIGLRGSDVPGYNERLRFLDALFLRAVSRRVWRSADFVTANSEALKKLALQTSPKLHIEVIPNGAEPVFPGNPPPVPPLRILFVGRLIRRKGVDYLIRALHLLKRESQKCCTLTIAGDGPERKNLQAVAEKLKVSSLVHFCGNARRDHLSSCFSNSHVLVMPSLQESLANAALEGMATDLRLSPPTPALPKWPTETVSWFPPGIRVQLLLLFSSTAAALRCL